MSTSWDPGRYLEFGDHRARAFHDLLARVGATAPRRVVDLGCGPGHLTGVLADRWPATELAALDGSPDMVAQARSRGVPAELADVRDWMPDARTDVVVSNAVLHWVPEHPELLARWLGGMPPGAWFALQVPGNAAAPTHTMVRELLAEPHWAGKVEPGARTAVLEPAGYGELLAAAGAEVDVWETTYLHRLTGADPVLRWISGSALRPARDALDDAQYALLCAQLAPRLRAAYPARPDGSTWLPFRRIFAVAHLG